MGARPSVNGYSLNFEDSLSVILYGFDKYTLSFSYDIVDVVIIRLVDRLHNSDEQSCSC